MSPLPSYKEREQLQKRVAAGRCFTPVGILGRTLAVHATLVEDIFGSLQLCIGGYITTSAAGVCVCLYVAVVVVGWGFRGGGRERSCSLYAAVLRTDAMHAEPNLDLANRAQSDNSGQCQALPIMFLTSRIRVTDHAIHFPLGHTF